MVNAGDAFFDDWQERDSVRRMGSRRYMILLSRVSMYRPTSWWRLIPGHCANQRATPQVIRTLRGRSRRAGSTTPDGIVYPLDGPRLVIWG
jgi:hypothetical protein